MSDSYKGHLELSGFKYGNLLMPLFGVLLVLYYTLKILKDECIITLDPGYIFLLIIPILFYILYYVTIGKDKYLRLEFKNNFD